MTSKADIQQVRKVLSLSFEEEGTAASMKEQFDIIWANKLVDDFEEMQDPWTS